MNPPLLSIIIPAFNAAGTVSTIVSQILEEKFRDFELIIVNDGSTDKSSSVLAALEQQDDRIVVVSQKNGGPSSARNAGLKEMKGVYVVFFDADDSIVPGALQTLVNTMEDTGSDLVVSGWRIDLGTVKGYKHISPHRTTVYQHGLATYVIRSIGTDGTLYNLWNKLFRADIIRQHNLRFREDLRFGEDLVFGFHYLRHTRQLDIIPDITYGYRTNSQTSVFSTSATVPAYRRDNAEELEEFGGTNRSEELDDLLNWVKWRWLLSYWGIVGGSPLSFREKLHRIRQDTTGHLTVARSARHIGVKKLILEKIASLLRHLPVVALVAGTGVHIAKRLVIHLKTIGK